MNKKELTEKQLATLKAGQFKPGDERIARGIERSMEVREQRKKWRDCKRFAAARKLSRNIAVGEKEIVLTGFDTERDLLRAETEIQNTLFFLSGMSISEIVKFLEQYRVGQAKLS